MNPERTETASSAQGTHAQFEETCWTVVITAGQTATSPAAREALARLCRTYWYPIYAFARRSGQSPSDASDVAQGFFLHMLEHDLVNKAEPQKGRFRTYLLSCLTNFLRDQWRKEAARKRGGAAIIVSIDEGEAEEKYRHLPAHAPDSAAVFDRVWAATVIEQAMQQVQQAYVSRGRGELFESLKRCLTGELSPDSYTEMAARLGMSRPNLEVNLSRFRSAFGECIRRAIAQTVANPADIPDEIRHLMAAWAGHLGAQQAPPAKPA